jgi:microcystin-dependent protein
MADPFVGELRLVGFNFAPVNWATADGQLMPISRNTALFSLLGTNFGGDGRSTFALPNLQGSIPVGAGQGPGLSVYDVGETGGLVTETLLQTEMPQHTHTVLAGKLPAEATSPANNAFTKSSAGNLYTTDTTPSNLLQMNSSIVTFFGSNLPHNNLMPYLTLNWIIALAGVFPARS